MGDEASEQHDKQPGASTSDETADVPSDEAFEVACACLNVRVTLRRRRGQQQDSEGDDDVAESKRVVVELDETTSRDGGAVRISHPRLAVEEAATDDKDKDKASSSSKSARTLTSLRCLCCECALLTYTQAGTGSRPLAPQSTDGSFILDISSQSRLVVGSERIAQLSDPTKNKDWSELFRLVLPTNEEETAKSADPAATGPPSTSTSIAQTKSLRKTPSSDTLDSKKSDKSPEDAADIDPREAPEHKSTGLTRAPNSSGSGGAKEGRPAASPFHSLAEARIAKQKKDLDAETARLTEAFEKEKKRYLEQAELLASKLISTSSTLASTSADTGSKAKRNPSPNTSRKASSSSKRVSSDATSPPQHEVKVIRGGFDDPVSDAASKATSPTRSQSIGATFVSNTASEHITSPNMPSLERLQSLFGSLKKKDAAAHAGADQAAPTAGTADASNAGIVQAKGPQSPTFRRSRSPSPSRDSSRQRQSSSERTPVSGKAADATATRGSVPLGRTTSSDQNAGGGIANLLATSWRRPAFNIDRDVSIQEQEWKLKLASEENRGRTTASTSSPSGTSVPTTSSIEPAQRTQLPQIASSYIAKGLAPRQPAQWLRLNDFDSSPPAKDTQPGQQEATQAQASTSAAAAGGSTSASARAASPSPLRSRPSVGKTRHVSFKEPEGDEDDQPESGSVTPALQEPSAEKETTREEEEMPFEMDEDIEASSEEESADEADFSFVTEDSSETRPNGRSPSSKSPSSSRSASGARANGSGSGSASSAPKSSAAETATSPILKASSQSKSTLGDSLSAILNDPSTFIGSVKSRGLGGYIPPTSQSDQPALSPVGLDSATARDRISLSDQAQRLRELLALDAPSHRGGRNKRKGDLNNLLLDGQGRRQGEDLTEAELDEVAPISALATSLPVAIGVPRFNRKSEFAFEQKTSVPEHESMLVPRLYHRAGAGRNGRRTAQPDGFDRLPVLGEEAESTVPSGSTSPMPAD